MYTQFEIESLFDGKLQIIYLNNPATYNALTRTTLAELRDFFNNANQDDNIRCIAISGRGKAFCSGQNLGDVVSDKENKQNSNDIYNIVKNSYNPLVTAITCCEKPIVALVNGPAVGAGAMLALICDFALASEKAYFSQAFSNIGLIPDTGGTYFLPKLIGRQMAHYLAFTGKRLSAEEAKKLGLVAEVFSEDEFSSQSMDILEKISNMPTTALKYTKQAFAKSYDNTLEQQLDLEAELQDKASKTEDFLEGVSAFLEKRKPIYKGK